MGGPDLDSRWRLRQLAIVSPDRSYRMTFVLRSAEAESPPFRLRLAVRDRRTHRVLLEREILAVGPDSVRGSEIILVPEGSSLLEIELKGQSGSPPSPAASLWVDSVTLSPAGADPD